MRLLMNLPRQTPQRPRKAQGAIRRSTRPTRLLRECSLIRRAQQLSEEGVADSDAADRLSAILQDPRGLDFTVGFVDRVVGTDDVHAAADALVDVARLTPDTMSALDRAQVKAGAALAPVLPQVVVPAARARHRP